jgi:hypothetical protein
MEFQEHDRLRCMFGTQLSERFPSWRQESHARRWPARVAATVDGFSVIAAQPATSASQRAGVRHLRHGQGGNRKCESGPFVGLTQVLH